MYLGQQNIPNLNGMRWKSTTDGTYGTISQSGTNLIIDMAGYGSFQATFFSPSEIVGNLIIPIPPCDPKVGHCAQRIQRSVGIVSSSGIYWNYTMSTFAFQGIAPSIASTPPAAPPPSPPSTPSYFMAPSPPPPPSPATVPQPIPEGPTFGPFEPREVQGMPFTTAFEEGTEPTPRAATTVTTSPLLGYLIIGGIAYFLLFAKKRKKK